MIVRALLGLGCISSAMGCSYAPSAAGSSINVLRLANSTRNTGWFTIFNNTDRAIRLINRQKPNAFFDVPSYQGQSFKWNGTKEVACYVQRTKGSQELDPIDCSKMITFSRCYERGVEGQGQRSDALQLVD